MRVKSIQVLLIWWIRLLLIGFFMCLPYAKAIVVLQYHHISDSTPELTSLSAELFEQHLNYLKENEFKVFKLKDFIYHLNKGKHFPRKSVLITFDDGYRSIYDTAFPLLKKYKYPFTVFVNTDPLEQKLDQFMTWEELQILIENGGSIANHSMTHPHMINKNQADTFNSKLEYNRTEIIGAEKLLQQKLSKSYRVFAYPYGEYDRSVKLLLKQLDYIAFGQHSGAVYKNSDRRAIPRFPFGGRFGSLEDFKIKVNSLALEVDQVTLFDDRGQRLNSHLLANGVKRINIALKLNKHQGDMNIQCFASDGSQLNLTHSKGQLVFAMVTDLQVGRSRINCTAPSDDKDSFYWFSQPLIKADHAGDFYS